MIPILLKQCWKYFCCRDNNKPINVLTGIDYWLDNLICNVPELVMCFHVNGIVQVSFELCYSDNVEHRKLLALHWVKLLLCLAGDIPGFETGIFPSCTWRCHGLYLQYAKCALPQSYGSSPILLFGWWDISKQLTHDFAPPHMMFHLWHSVLWLGGSFCGCTEIFHFKHERTFSLSKLQHLLMYMLIMIL